MPDVFAMLRGEHRAIEALLDELADLPKGARRTRERVVATVVRECRLHSMAEEAVLYDRLRSVDETRGLVLESLEEHELVARMLTKLETLDVDDETFDAKVAVLRELIELHIAEEESELFAKVHQLLEDPDLEAMASELGSVRQTLARAFSEGALESTSGRPGVRPRRLEATR